MLEVKADQSLNKHQQQINSTIEAGLWLPFITKII